MRYIHAAFTLATLRDATAMYELCRKTTFVQRAEIVFMLHAIAFVLVNLLLLLLHRLCYGSTSDFNANGADLPVKCVCEIVELWILRGSKNMQSLLVLDLCKYCYLEISLLIQCV